MPSFDFKRLNRTINIYRGVQALLVGMLIYIAYIFQNSFAMLGKPEKFMSTIVAAVVIQLLLFYPIYRLAGRDVTVEVESSAVGLTQETLAALRKKRLLGDLWKFSVVGFFLAFVAMMPDAKKAVGVPIILAVTIFSFLFMCLTYFQCFNFSARKQINKIR